MIRLHHLLLSLIGLLGICIVVQAGTPHFDVKLWTSPIPYTFDEQYNETMKNTFRAALQLIMDNTCIDFKEGLDGPQLAYVVSTKFCGRSTIGDRRNGGNQIIEFLPGCEKISTILHETYHALGFSHEHQRPDRDTYITVDMNNIEDDGKSSLEKETVNENTKDYGIPYEYGSILHYRMTTGYELDKSKPGITPKDKDYTETINAQGPLMAYNDWKVINLHYKCSENCTVKISCQNGGYRHPRKCTECVCTKFYEGPYCEIERHPHTLAPGATLRLDFGWHYNESTYQGIDARFSPNDPMPDLTKLERSPARLIKAPEGERIRVTINNIFDSEIAHNGCDTGCVNKAVEIVDGELTRVGKRFCCNRNLPYSFVSETNVVGYHMDAIPGLHFFANVTFIVEGSVTNPEPEPIAPITTTTTIAPRPNGIEMVDWMNQEDYPRDRLIRWNQKLCYCSDKGFKCGPYDPKDPTLPTANELMCSCKQISVKEQKCALQPKT